MVAASERELAALALHLGAAHVPTWSAAEVALARNLPDDASDRLRAVAQAIRRGEDPLGVAFCSLRSPEARRPRGATYTPAPIVRSMLAWARAFGAPARVVDVGAGSGRFLLAAGRCFRSARLVGVELDPLAALIARAQLASAGLANRAEILVADYRDVKLAPVEGRTFFVGNPPYVRHHLIDGRWKAWLVDQAAGVGIEASQLAGLHAYFFLATLLNARAGDFGAFITSAEWLDVNYGRLVRELFLGGLGGHSISVIEPRAQPFPDAATTGAITCFEIGSRPRTIRLRRVATLDDLGDLGGGRRVRRERLEAERRWTPLTRSGRTAPEGFVELGEICRVHRGQVTGANDVWIAGPDSPPLPTSVLFPTVTRARELFKAGDVLSDSSALRRVIDLPLDLDVFPGEERRLIDRFLRHAQARRADRGYIARKRKAWWSVGLRGPAPILATYMARRPPAFVRNRAEVRHINIAHGLYPLEPLPEAALTALARYLSRKISTDDGRTYAGGLTKFEPKEMERLLVPEPAVLVATAGEALASP
jgi:methylase of polypeptide subunit release factors